VKEKCFIKHIFHILCYVFLVACIRK